MTRRAFVNVRAAHCSSEIALDHSLMQMMAPTNTLAVDERARRGEHVPPRKLAFRRWILSRQRCGESRRLHAQTLILATGMDYEVPDVPGFAEHWGGSVFHCPFCHGWEVRNRKLVVYADEAMADRLHKLARGWSDDVTLVGPAEVAELRSENGTVKAVVRTDGSEVPCDAVLLHAAQRRRGELPEGLGLELTDAGQVAVDQLGQTSVPGVYAAGDLAVAPQQVAIAAGSGHVAGIAVVRELLLGRPS